MIHARLIDVSPRAALTPSFQYFQSELRVIISPGALAGRFWIDGSYLLLEHQHRNHSALDLTQYLPRESLKSRRDSRHDQELRNRDRSSNGE